MQNSSFDVVVIGAGVAGLTAARAAVAEGAERVLLVNGEDRAPYKRTKVSKHLTAPYATDAFALMARPEPGLERIDARVAAIDPASRSLRLEGGGRVRFGALVLATGAVASHRFAPSSLVLRDAADGDRLNRLASDARSAAIIGGGVLGVEVADQLLRRGLEVTLFSRASALMDTLLGAEPARWLTELAAQRGVQVALGATVSEVEALERGFRVCADRLCVEADLVVECSGSAPDTRLARASGLAVEQGVIVDGALASSAPGIFAAGDCAQLPGGRVPHLWHEAEDQGATAGRNAARFASGRTRVPHPHRPRRLKCEVFDRYLFSLEPGLLSDAPGLLTVREPERWLQLGFVDGALCAVVMTGDKPRAKDYERAVWEGISAEEARARFGIDGSPSPALAGTLSPGGEG